MKTFDEKEYKRKYGKEEKQYLLPPSHLQKRAPKRSEYQFSKGKSVHGLRKMQKK